jgi:putative hydrolase
VSDSGPLDPGDDPFKGVPIFGDLAKLLQQQGSVNWELARQTAAAIATEGKSEPNVDPVDRMQLEQLARVAELHIAQATPLPVTASGRPLSILPVTRWMWVTRTLDDYRPLLDRLAQGLGPDKHMPPAGADPAALEGFEGDPFAAMMGPLMQLIGPVMLGVSSGSMLGHLARRTLGQYDLPIPRPASDELMIVLANVDAFGESWSLPRDDLRLWVCLHAVAHHAVLGAPHIRQRLDSLLHEYVSGFEPDPGALEQRLGDIDPSDPNAMRSMQEALGDPQALLGAMQSDAQRALRPHLDALVAVIVGYVDYVMDTTGEGLVSSYSMVTEAVRRHRVEADASDRFVERLLGLDLSQATYERGAAFVAGVVERAGAEGLDRLWVSDRELPTPAEVDAPGLWLARIDLPD